MVSKLLQGLSACFAVVGLFLIMGAVGSDDYLVMQGLEGLPWGVLIGRVAIGFGCFLFSVFFWRVANDK